MCDYSTKDVEAVIAAALLTVHNSIHAGPASVPVAHNQQKAPKLVRPTVSRGSSEETWNAFSARWDIFKAGTQLTAAETTQQLFQ